MQKCQSTNLHSGVSLAPFTLGCLWFAPNSPLGAMLITGACDSCDQHEETIEGPGAGDWCYSEGGDVEFTDSSYIIYGYVCI